MLSVLLTLILLADTRGKKNIIYIISHRKKLLLDFFYFASALWYMRKHQKKLTEQRMYINTKAENKTVELTEKNVKQSRQSL
jgi:hypothetical protein